MTTLWKRRDSAWSFSNDRRYSSWVVAPMQRRPPEASPGLRILEASMEPPLVAPAPTIVWISSMNSTACGIAAKSAMTAFRRASKSPRNLLPASSAPMSSAKMRRSENAGGTSPSSIRRARPSAIAVLPTPASPTRIGLFL